jgi:tRNA/tmRNA/rRNA uracil-C5-methylase (TrmA/RlmC/RlmD family)
MAEPGNLVELDAGSIAAGGACVSHAPDGRVVFVRHCLPGERVLARLTGVGARFLRADAVEVLRRSGDRVDPPCPHAGAGRCGGCDWQHATLTAQRAMKADLVRQALGRIAGLEVALAVEPVGRSDGLRWRSRVRFGIEPSGRAGLRRHRSHELEPVTCCPIASEAVEALGLERRRWRGAREVEVFAPHGGDVLVSVVPRSGARVRLPDSTVEVVAGPGAHTWCAVRVDGLDRGFRVSAGAFWQVHVDAPELLVRAVLDALAPMPGDRVADLHAGVGLFTVHLAAAVGPGGSVIAVERDPVACADAEANGAGLSWLRLRCATVDAQLVESLPELDRVVLDPPRTGAGTAVLDALTRRRPRLRRLVYVACDAASFARDLRVASKPAGRWCRCVRSTCSR